MPPRKSLAQMMSNNGETSRDNTDDEGLVAGASKRQRLDDGTCTKVCAGNEFSHEDYTIGWVCALPKEMAAAMAMLDIVHETLRRAANDSNTYALGRIAGHNVVIVCLPSGYYGNNSAATVTSNMRRSFPSIRLCLMVGIGGGVPAKVDIRLGDVVVGEGVLQHDIGKTISEGILTRTGHVNRPPQELLTAVAKLRAGHEIGSSQIPSHLSEMLKRHPIMTQYFYRDSLQDRLFESTYEHVESMEISTDNCELCNPSRLVQRPPRAYQNTKIHYGIIASGNQVLKHGKTRDELAHKLNALCVEMEGAGVMDGFAGLIVRGICDYSDSHKNKQWQELAAAVAAAYAKELLSAIPIDGDRVVPTIALPSVHLDRQRHLLDSLKFDQMDARRTNIKAKYSTTCQWLLTHSDYVDWLDPSQADKHHGFLWIRGSPGTGKSTLMSFICKEMLKENKRIVISFFFNARGDGLERSTFGMYRSLLFQALNAMPSLLDVFDEPEHKGYLNELYTAMLSYQDFEWHIGVLQDLLRSALVRLDQAALTIFVDALDECAADQVEELIEYFEGVGENAVLNGSRLNTCFSSRYYPHIDIQYGRKINLEDQDGHEKDIAIYIQNKLKVGKSKIAEEVKAEIQTKAKGIFMWVVLVVDILKAEYKNGRIFDVKKRLAVLPAKLGDLFKQILSRDQKNLQDLQLCIQWILFSRRPLKLEEYYFAAVSRLNPSELREWDPDEVTTDDMSRFVISSSKGLAETTKTKLRTVQFIHESVREFFLKDGLRELWPTLAAADFESASHAQLQQCCYSYLGVGTSGHVRSPLPKATSDEAKQLRAAVSRKFPFLEYATRHVLSHANAAANLVLQRDFLSDFPREAWICLDNFFETFEVRRHTANASLLYILVEKNFTRLIEDALCLDPFINIKGERHRFPLFAALANGHRDAVKSLLQTAASCFEDDVLARLDYGSNFNTKRWLTPLLWAAAKGHEAVVRSLHEKGSGIEERDRSLCTPLILAANNGHTAVVQLLLAKGCDIEAREKTFSTSLHKAVRNGHTAVVQLLLEKGVNVEAQDALRQTPLFIATSSGHSAIVQLLVAKGCNIEANASGVSPPPLLNAARNGHTSIVQLLLERGANVDVKNRVNTTPLMAAAGKGYANIVRLLLENDANVDAKDVDDWTPLRMAAGEGYELVVRLLLEKGASVDARDTNDWTPLMMAATRGYEAVVRLLLERGASVDARDTNDWTPLMMAAAQGNEAVVRLLLMSGAKVDAEDKKYQTPLMIAARYAPNNTAVELLLEKGEAIKGDH